MNIEPWFLLVFFLLMIIFLGLLIRNIFIFFTVRGQSMSPLLNEGDRALAVKHFSSKLLKVDHIVISKYVQTQWNSDRHPIEADRELYLKRIVGLPGDVIETLLDELPPDLQDERQSEHDKYGKMTWEIPPEHCFLRGETPGFDSVIIGPVPFSAIQGIVVTKI